MDYSVWMGIERYLCYDNNNLYAKTDERDKKNKKRREENMKKLIIIRGNSGSGKTSVAKALQKKYGPNTMRISQDAVRREMLLVRDCPENESIALMCELLRHGRQHCERVILEGILYSDIYQELFRTAAEEYGTEIYAFYYQLPIEETLRRHETRDSRLAFGEADMRQWWREDDFIGKIPEKFLGKERSLEDTVSFIYREVENAGKVRFYDTVEDSFFRFAVILTRYQGQWVFCKHKERDTYEAPGGHREAGESILETAKRELWEEAGAEADSLKPVCAYSVVQPGARAGQGEETFGMLYLAEVTRMEEELHYEIEKRLISRELPRHWTYPEIQPKLLEEAVRRGFLSGEEE